MPLGLKKIFSRGLPPFLLDLHSFEYVVIYTNCILRLSNDLLSVSVIYTANLLKFLTYKSSVLYEKQ